MQLPFTSIKDITYNKRLSCALRSEDYEHSKNYSDILNRPIFTIQDAQLIIRKLTYRMINDWDTKDLISCSREKEASGWRKFSILDVLKLHIISALRDYGFSTENIKDIINKVAIASVYAENTKTGQAEKVDFMQIEHFAFACLNGLKMLLLIDDGKKVYFVAEQDLIDIKHFFNGVTAPLIVLPFFSYFENVASIVFEQKIKIKEDRQLLELFSNVLEGQEKKILELIRDKEYKEIRITKSDGDEITLKATTRKGGAISEKDVISAIREKAYQTVKLTKVNGQIVSVVQEEPIKP